MGNLTRTQTLPLPLPLVPLGTKTVFLAPTRYAKHPRAFYMEVPPLRDASMGEADVKSCQ